MIQAEHFSNPSAPVPERLVLLIVIDVKLCEYLYLNIQ